jgi:hypothetical protein
VISSAGQPEEQPDLKKPTALRGEVGVWDRESGDRIKGCDGACIHAEGSLAGAGGWSITNVTAFTFSSVPPKPQKRFHRKYPRPRSPVATLSRFLNKDWNNRSNKT